MRDAPSNDPHHNSQSAQQQTSKDVSNSLLVDEFGNPYGKENHSQKPRSVVLKFFKNLGRPKGVNIFLTAIIAVSTVVQTCNSRSNNRSSGLQAERLIDAANRVDDAAGSFSHSASGINQGVSDAVNRLQAQAHVTELARETSAAQNELTLRNTIESSRLDQRAWVAAEAITALPNTFVAGQTAFLEILFRNTGRTPAKNVRIATIHEATRRGSPPPFQYSAPSRYGLMAPNGTAFNHIPVAFNPLTLAPLPLDDRSIQQLTSGDETLYIHGELTYDDIFGQQHWTTYCYFLSNLPGPVAPAACPEHNDTGDGDVPKYKPSADPSLWPPKG